MHERVAANSTFYAYSESSLARETGIAKSTIHRALKNAVRLTKTHQALCKFDGIDLNVPPIQVAAREELIREVLDIWDGTRQHAHSIAKLLRAAAILQAYGAGQSGRLR